VQPPPAGGAGEPARQGEQGAAQGLGDDELVAGAEAEVSVGDRVVTDAIWSYQDPLAGRYDIKGYLALYWNRMEAWFEEDEEVVDPAMVPFAATYADQNERDSRALPGVVGSGRRTAQAGC
jgi:hypothetical protein